MNKTISGSSFEIVNKNGEAILFKTDKPDYNVLTLTFTNRTSSPLTLTGGEPVRIVKGATENQQGSVFNFNFEGMLIPEVVQHLQLTLPPSWKAVFLPPTDKNIPASWSIAPEIDITLAPKESFKVEMRNMIVANVNPGNFMITYANIPGFVPPLIPITKHLGVLSVPNDQLKTLPLSTAYINPVHFITGQNPPQPRYDMTKVKTAEAIPIYITYDQSAQIQNGFTLLLSNTSKDPLVPDASYTDFLPVGDSNPPVVYISFLFGEEDYAITSQALADNNMRIDVKATLPWSPVAHVGGNNYWEFNPQSKQVMQGRETVQFPVSKIITELNVDPDTISLMYVQVNNIPGYNDAEFVLHLHKKKAVAKMQTLEASKRDINVGENVAISWTSFLAKRVTIDYKTRGGGTVFLDSAKGEIKLDGTNMTLPQMPSLEQTAITASAYDNSDKPSTLEKTVYVNLKPAEIRSFYVGDALAVMGEDKPDSNVTGREFAAGWNVAFTQKLILTTPSGDVDVTGRQFYFIGPLDRYFKFVLRAYSYFDIQPQVAEASHTVWPFWQESSIAVPLSGSKLQSYPAMMLNKLKGRLYAANSAENMIYDIDPLKLTTDKKYPGNVMHLSRKGEKLLVFNPVNGKTTFGTTMYDTTSGAKSRNASFYSQIAGPYPGISLRMTEDLQRIYFSCEFIHGPHFLNAQYFQVDAGGNHIGQSHGITAAGSRIFAIALNRSSDKIYVLHNTSVEITQRPDHPLYKEIPLYGAEPGMVIEGKLSDTLYVNCLGDNRVVFIDTVKDQVAGYTELPGKPVNIVLTPNEKYLIVALGQANKVAVVNTQTHTIAWTFDVPGVPYGLRTNYNGEVLFIGSYCGKTLYMYSLPNRYLNKETFSTGDTKGNPFDIEVYEDDKIMRVYVAKEHSSERITCKDAIANTSLDISVITFDKQAKK
jgi:DNA-binding beta-propeller fold protein YncE